MPESRTERINRLNEEGNLPDFMEAQKEYQEMVDNGTMDADSMDALLEKRFGVSDVVVNKDDDERDLVARDAPREARSLQMSDLEWVYSNLGMENLREQDAPSPGAWAVWDDCRNSQRQRQWLMGILVKNLNAESDGVKEDNKAQRLNGLDVKIRKEFGEFSKKLLETAC